MDLIASIFVAIFLFILIIGGLGMLTIFIIDKIVNKPQKDIKEETEIKQE